MQPLPIGVDDFKKLREIDYYYIDKTLLIQELLDNRSEVSLFTRPRRFGKTLGLSMIKYFFELSYDQFGNRVDNRQLFLGLKIMEAGEAYTKSMGQFPVISLTMKSAKQPTYEMAYCSMMDEIAKEFDRHSWVLKSDLLEEDEKEQFCSIRAKKGTPVENVKSLEFLSRCLFKVSGKKTVILLDEYDVPLENAYFKGYYEQMTDFIRSLFESSLKTNLSLEFAVVTGCLRISKESIFTGLNNLEIISILSNRYAEHFGFTAGETARMLRDYGAEEKLDEVKRWYNGYLFGTAEVYNPWSMINYVKEVSFDKEVFPRAYWANTSSNGIVREMVERADAGVRQEMEVLIEGGTIEKRVHEDITYGEIHKSQDNLWNFLFFTGYLKKVKERFSEDNLYITLAIPNAEVKSIYRNTILDWFGAKIRQKDFTALYMALLNRNISCIEREISRNLMETISFFDYKEDYYHGFLTGILKQIDGFLVKSNRENGLGRSDLLLLSPPYEGTAVIIEVKVADTYAQLPERAEEALRQIHRMQYDGELKLEGYHSFYYYGIAFYKKLCRVQADK